MNFIADNYIPICSVAKGVKAASGPALLLSLNVDRMSGNPGKAIILDSLGVPASQTP